MLAVTDERSPIVRRSLLLALALTMCPIGTLFGGTFEKTPLAPEVGLDVLTRRVAREQVGRDLFANPYATVTIANVDVYDRFPYVETRHFQVVSDPRWNRVVYGERGRSLRAYDGRGGALHGFGVRVHGAGWGLGGLRVRRRRGAGRRGGRRFWRRLGRGGQAACDELRAHHHGDERRGETDDRRGGDEGQDFQDRSGRHGSDIPRPAKALALMRLCIMRRLPRSRSGAFCARLLSGLNERS